MLAVEQDRYEVMVHIPWQQHTLHSVAARHSTVAVVGLGCLEHRCCKEADKNMDCHSEC